MEIKDIAVTVERMDEVRGGFGRIARGNSASNFSSNGPVVSAVLVGARNSNGSTFQIDNSVGQFNTTSQVADVHAERSWERKLSLSGSQLTTGFSFFN
jgi:hypothetical protein